jgi:hypothetical protein
LGKNDAEIVLIFIKNTRRQSSLGNGKCPLSRAAKLDFVGKSGGPNASFQKIATPVTFPSQTAEPPT